METSTLLVHCSAFEVLNEIALRLITVSAYDSVCFFHRAFHHSQRPIRGQCLRASKRYVTEAALAPTSNQPLV